MTLLRGVLDLKPFPIFLVTCDLVAGFMNRTASCALQRDGLVVSSKGILHIRDGESNARFVKTMKTLAAEERSGPTVFLFDVPDRSTRVMNIKALPIRVEGDRGGGQPMPWYEISVRASLGYLKVPPDRIASALHLTHAEANLASAMAEGLSLQDYASRESLKITTVRWHLQNIFDRTATRSQAELMSVMVNLFG